MTLFIAVNRPRDEAAVLPQASLHHPLLRIAEQRQSQVLRLTRSECAPTTGEPHQQQDNLTNP